MPTVTSTCERQFIANCVAGKQKRVDGRQLHQGRTLKIIFGKDSGCCMVLLGGTQVLVQISCEISEPRASVPSEGIMHVNFELSAMASPDAKSQSRTSEETVESQRAVERCIRDSKCIDLESLCIISGIKVWIIRVDIHPLNDEGNLTECSSIAALAALSHFKRPDVSVVGTEVTVHPVEKSEPVSLNLHHMPISICLALFGGGKTIVVDPNEIEERVCDGCYVIGINAHQEICFVHRRGVLLLQEDTIQQCEDIAVKRAQEVTQAIRAALDDNAYKKLTKAPIGFTNLIKTGTILGAKHPMAEIDFSCIKNLQENAGPAINDVPRKEENESVMDSENAREEIRTMPYNNPAKQKALRILQESETAIFEGGPSKWGEDIQDEDDEEEEGSTSVEENIGAKKNTSTVKEEIDLDSEEDPVFVDEDQVDVKTPVGRGWYSKDPFK